MGKDRTSKSGKGKNGHLSGSEETKLSGFSTGTPYHASGLSTGGEKEKLIPQKGDKKKT
jgi:hypothetical protein